MMRALEILAVIGFGVVVVIGATTYVKETWRENTPALVEALK